MACRTLLCNRLVNNNDSLVLHFLGEMAFFTRNLCMSALQLERAVTIVHEGQLRPVCCLMAFFTTHQFALAELAAMHIVMAGDAAEIERAVACHNG